MAIRKILTDGDETLRKKSRVVTEFNERLHELLDDMRETLIDVEGLGLAAPQVGVLRRVALILDTSSEAETVEEKMIELVNPEIVKAVGEDEQSEACLSVPGMVGIVTRPETVTVRAFDRFGKEFSITVSEITARAACHEIDHLEGIIYTSIADPLFTDEEFAEYLAEEEEEFAELLAQLGVTEEEFEEIVAQEDDDLAEDEEE